MELRAPSRKQEAAVGKKHSKFQTITLCGTEYFINDVRTIDGTTVLRTAVRWGASSHRAPSRCSHQHVEHHGEAPFRAIAADDHEGNVAKRADAPYRAGSATGMGEDQEQKLLTARSRGGLRGADGVAAWRSLDTI